MTYAMNPMLRTITRLLLGVLLLAAVVSLSDPSRIWNQLRQAHWSWVALGLVAAVASNVVSAIRWQSLASWMGACAPLKESVRWYFQAIGLNTLLPGAVVGGDVFRAVMLRRAGQDPVVSGWSVALDRISGLWMLCAIGAIGAAYCASVLAPIVHVPSRVLRVVALLGAALLVVLPSCLPKLMRWGVMSGQWLAPLRTAALRHGFERQLRWQVAISAAVQILSAAALASGGAALGVWQPLQVWMFAIMPVFLMAALPVSVGGWGTREAACVAALVPFGVPAAAAVGVAIIYGLYGFAQGALGALAFGLPRTTKNNSE